MRPAPEVSVPSFAEVRSGFQPSDIQVLDRSGEIIHEIRIDPSRRRLQWTPLSEVSPALQAAVLASEDRRFYQHGGVDGFSLASAAYRRLTDGQLRGGSTITMQLAGMLHENLKRSGSPRTLSQKWRQMKLAWAIEAMWSKAEILEAYLNRVTFRGELQGMGAASHVLFGKLPHGLTDAEAAVMAALIRSPNAGREAVTRRAGGLTLAGGALDAAVSQALEAPSGTGPRATLAPHAAYRVLRNAQDAHGGGSPIRTTLDGALQRMASETLQRHLLALRDQRVQDGAILVVDNATGDVLAYVGGSGKLSSARYVDGVQARRQAGSILKPFLYGLALEQRLLTTASLLEDRPLEISTVRGLYRPKNYDEQFQGLVTVRTALASSLNIPAVRTLELAGAETFVQQLRRLGFEGVRESGEYYGPALALGSADVSLWELVHAYRTLANGGVWSPLRMAPGEPRADTRRLYSREAAFLISSILSDRESRMTTFGLENPLAKRFWCSVKTGTSKEMRDNWCVGYSGRYTVGVWVGNFSGEPMRDVSGISGAAPVWMEVMVRLHRSTPSRQPDPPAGVVARSVAGGAEWFIRGTEPAGYAQAHTGTIPRIIAPVAGTVIALDPDVPSSRQRMVFEARDGAGLRWVMNGTDLGSVSAITLWEPEPGRHALALVDEAQHIHDAVHFEVRGR
ncbi:MAG: penicillin-binding protein 1C [Nitrospirae bacterium]|nr:penicillin-binding protein 1C [Nitrospirota bacterium]